MTDMRSVDHTHPHTDEPFGATFVDHAVVADGGRDDAAAATADGGTMEDVDHETPDGEGADPAFERGTEGRSETV